MKREANEKSPIIDKIVINSIKETMEAWRKKKRFAKHKKNVIFASRTRVVIWSPTLIDRVFYADGTRVDWHLHAGFDFELGRH